jgi:hypothetical protein
MPTTSININTAFNAGGATAAEQALNKTAATARKAASDFERLDRQYNAIRDSEIRAARASGDHARALQLIDAQLAAASQGTVRYNNLLGQQARASQNVANAQQQQMASLRSSLLPAISQGTALTQQFGAAMQTQLLSVAGPAALATAALGGVSQAIQAGKDALALRETLNGLRAVSGSTLVYADAVATAKRQQILFGGTLQENIEGLQGLVITSRDTGAKLQDLVDLSQRLTVKSPEQGAAGSRIAIQEAFSEGNITSLARRFEIPRARIEALKDASIPAAEKVKILSDYLDSIGISSEAVAGKVDKTAQSYREFAAALEAARLKLGEVAAEQGKGVTGQATGALTGITQLVTAYQELTQNAGAFGQTVGAILTPLNTYNNMLITGWTEALKWAGATFGAADATRQLTDIEDIRAQQTRTTTDAVNVSTDALSKEAKQKLDDKIETAQLAQQQAQLEQDSIRAAQGLLGAGDQALILAQKYGIAADQAQFLIDKQQKLSNATALADQRVGERDPSNTLTAAEFRAFDRLSDQGAAEAAAAAKAAADKLAADQKAAAEKAAQEAERLQDVQFDNQLKKTKDNAAKIRLLRERQAKTADPVERAQIEGQIIDLQNQKVGGLQKEANLQESIYDAIQKQKDAMLDIEELSIRDRQQDREDAAKRRTAERILASPNASADMKARAADAIALIDVQDRKRAFELEQKQATVGGTITDKGRLLQSVPGGGAVPSAAAPMSIPQAAPVPTGGGGNATLTINLVADGKTLASVSEPYIMESLMKAVETARARAGA